MESYRPTAGTAAPTWFTCLGAVARGSSTQEQEEGQEEEAEEVDLLSLPGATPCRSVLRCQHLCCVAGVIGHRATLRPLTFVELHTFSTLRVFGFQHGGSHRQTHSATPSTTTFYYLQHAYMYSAPDYSACYSALQIL